jgi:hypothetical protein
LLLLKKNQVYPPDSQWRRKTEVVVEAGIAEAAAEHWKLAGGAGFQAVEGKLAQMPANAAIESR